MTKLTQEDHRRVAAAIAAAEAGTDGEIVAVATDASDAYHDAALHLAAGATFIWLGLAAFWPGMVRGVHDALLGGWSEPDFAAMMTFVLLGALAIFLLVLLVLRHRPLRYALVPGPTKTRRVRRRAIQIYKAGAERRTVGRTGILAFLSLGEHRAEIVHDEGITEVVEPGVWGHAMAVLLEPVSQGRIADGLVAAIEEIGDVLHVHLPRSADDENEIPDKLIEL